MFEDGVNRLEAFNQPRKHGELELTHCGYEKCVPRFAAMHHIRDCYLIHYVMSGHGYFKQDGKTYEVGPGQLFTIFPGRIVSYYAPDPEDPWIFCWFGFQGSIAMDMLNAAGISFERPIQALGEDGQFLATIRECTDTLYYSKSTSSSFLKCCMYKLFYCLENALRPETQDGSRHDRLAGLRLYQNAVAFIDYNYNKPITVQDVADHLMIDRSYCWKIFQLYAGRSPQQYLMHFRIDKAAGLLLQSDLSLSETAQCIGIPDLYYFSRVFKKIKGVSPSRYAKEQFRR